MRRVLVRVVLPVGGVVVLAAGLLAAGTALGSPSGAPNEAPAAASRAAAAPRDALASAQRAVQVNPGSADAWTALGMAQVSRARLTADPTAYPAAQQAFDRSLQLQGPAQNFNALTGEAVLQASKHHFAQALALTDRSLAIDALSPTTYGVRVDALTELGRYGDALAAAQRMLDLRPAVDSLSRASYQAELRGRVQRSAQLLQQAEQDASSDADRAYAEQYLGELDMNTGNLSGARAHIDRALEFDPNSVPALVDRARLLAMAGQTTAALGDYREAVGRVPLPQYEAELGELLDSAGQHQQAQAQYAVVRTIQRLFATQGADVDYELALFEADHGTPADALTYAQRAYRTRPDAVLVEDAYAWALHRAGRDTQALPIARRALRLGTVLPLLHDHLGTVAAAVGDRGLAKAELTRALALNPTFSPLLAPQARALLASLS